MKKKIMAVALATIIAVMAVAGASLAWLKETTDPITNTFTEGKVDITLTESDALNLKMVPGSDITKDPTVAVVAGSEACWLFVKIQEQKNLDTFISYVIGSGWSVLDGVVDTEDATPGDETIIIYRSVSAADALAGVTYPVLAGNKVTVNNTVEMSHMTALTETTRPQLKFTAYAIQSASFADVNDAWTEVSS